MTQLEALRNAVEAKIKYWDAMNEMEAAFGFPDGEIPDKVSDLLVTAVENIASGVDFADQVEETYVIDILGEISEHTSAT